MKLSHEEIEDYICRIYKNDKSTYDIAVFASVIAMAALVMSILAFALWFWMLQMI